MTTTFFLTRHAVHDRVGTVLCGRTPGIRLGDTGRAQAQRLAERLAVEPIASVQTSPLERARETAEPIAQRVGCEAAICGSANEIDFGDWSGRTFEDLLDDAGWTQWNGARAVTRPPRGETMLEVQARMVDALERLRHANIGKSVVMVSHGDVIKSALLYYLGMPIDAFGRFDIDPASVSTLVVGNWGSKVIRLNEVIAR